MTAEHVAEPDREPDDTPGTRWPVPPRDGYTVDDLFTLPDLPPHTELIDGSLVFVSPQRDFHSTVIDLLVTGLRRSVGFAHAELKVRREMTVVLGSRNATEPDISVVRSDAVTGPDQTHFRAEDVVIAVEVVSPDSTARDNDTKPLKYAAAGIPNLWLVDMGGMDHHPVVRVYELDRHSKAYQVTGIHHDELKIRVPFDIDIDITLDALREL